VNVANAGNAVLVIRSTASRTRQWSKAIVRSIVLSKDMAIVQANATIRFISVAATSGLIVQS
jgi:hypothetical protein